MLGDNEISELILDSEEILEKIETALIDLENGAVPEAERKDVINTLFRHFHTLKGNAGFFNFNVIVSLSHSAESLLDIIRNDISILNAEILSLFISARDMLSEIFTGLNLHKTDESYREKSEKLIQKLKELKESFSSVKQGSEEEKPRYGIFKKKKKIVLESKEELKKEILASRVEKVELTEKSVNGQAQDSSNSLQKKDIRIETRKLDYLLDMIGELVIAESLVTQNPDIKGLELPNFMQQSSYLNKVVRNLQEVSLQLRMVTLESLFHKMSRLVRDLSLKTEKKIDLNITGGETEIDKNLLELLNDPMVHIIRNSIDHGIETREERLKANKSEIASIKIKAFHSGNEVWIVISDDGRGLDRDRILSKALSLGLIDETEIENLKEEEVWNFIFQPGFSTSEKVTDISGRGVGLDIVHRNILKLNGDIEVKTRSGNGTTFFLKLPLTIAIIEGMVVKYRDISYIIPTIEVKETLNLKELKIEEIHEEKQVIRYRNQLVPVINLEKLLKKDIVSENENIIESLYLIIVEYRDHCLGIIFDEIVGNQSVVIKPLPALIEDTTGFSGCTILGSGKIGMILDIKFLINNYYKENKKTELVYE